MRPIFPSILALFFIFTNAQAKDIRIGVIADMNGSACQASYPTTSKQAYDYLLRNHELDHLIMAGDAVAGQCPKYSGSIPYQEVVRSMWEEFDSAFFRPALERERASLVLAPGNHDAPYLFPGSKNLFRRENEGFVNYWQNQQQNLRVNRLEIAAARDKFPYYWAYTYENVLFIVLQSTRTHSLSNSIEQKNWLRALLSTPEARNARAKIAFGHVPPYPVLDPSVGSKYKEIIEQEQVGNANSLMDILLDHDVDLLVMGHSHAPYPGELKRKSDLKSIRILSMPCGHAPRKLVSKKSSAPRGYAVVELKEESGMQLSIYDGADGARIPSSYFPASIPLRDSKVIYQRNY